MIDFKSMLAKDLDTFINTNEFADIHTINGTEVKAIIDSNVLTDEGDSFQATFTSAISIYLSQDAPVRLPTTGTVFDLDGFQYLCESLKIEQGCNVIIASEVIAR